MSRILNAFMMWWVLWTFTVPPQNVTVIEVSQTGKIPTISAALNQAKTLNTQNIPVQIVVNPGTYRETLTWQNSTNASLEITAKEPHTVVVSGADVWQFNKVGANYVGVWNNNWGYSEIPPGWTQNGLNVEVKPIVRRREVLIVEGTVYTPVLTSAELAPGRFHVDETANTITVRALVEPLGVAQVGIRERTTNFYRTNNVTVRGIVFEGAATHFDKDGAYFNENTNLRLLNNIFRKNSAGGLGVFRSDGLESRNNTYEQNGMSGYTGAYNHDFVSRNETACFNNWRGVLGGFIGWSVAGVKHLHQRNADYLNLVVCDNAAHGLWLDTDMDNVIVDGLISTNNLNSGVYVEAVDGIVIIRSSVIRNNELKGLYISSVHKLTVENTIIEGNRKEAQIYIGGNCPVRTSWNHTTGRNYDTYPAKDITLRNNTIVGISEVVPAFWYVTCSFHEQFKPTYIGIENVWKNQNNSRPFRVGNNFPTWYTNAQWALLTGQDQIIPTLTITASPTPTIVTTPFVPSSTPSRTPTPTITPVITPTPKRYKIIFGGELWFEVVGE